MADCVLCEETSELDQFKICGDCYEHELENGGSIIELRAIAAKCYY